MEEQVEMKELDSVVVHFSSDSGDGMQLAGNIFITVSATVGSGVSTFPDHPADIRAPQDSLTGAGGFQVHIGAGKVYTPGDLCDVLVVVNAAALKMQHKHCKPNSTTIIDTGSSEQHDLQEAEFRSDDYLNEIGIDPDRAAACPITKMVRDCLAGTGMDNKSMLKCRNMLALGLVCWFLGRDLELVNNYLRAKFKKKPAIAEVNIKVVRTGYDYGHNVHASVPNTYRIESTVRQPSRYMDITGNKTTTYGLVTTIERASLCLFLGSYPITPAADILRELSKHKSMGVTTVQREDEIAGYASAIGAAFTGALTATLASSPGICLRGEAMNLILIDELPLVIIDIQHGGPSTGMPAKNEQTDLLQVPYGRNGENPMPATVATSPTNCFDAAYNTCKIALEHVTPIVLLTDVFVANGSSAWKLPNIEDLPEIHSHYVTEDQKYKYTPYKHDPKALARYWAIPGAEGYTHILDGLEKDSEIGAISTDPGNHDKMDHLRRNKVAHVPVPDLVVQGDEEGVDLPIVGSGSTYDHLYSATKELRRKRNKITLAQFKYVDSSPKNTAEVLSRYMKVVVTEQNLGQFTALLHIHTNHFTPYQYNRVKGQPFAVMESVTTFEKLLKAPLPKEETSTFYTKILE